MRLPLISELDPRRLLPVWSIQNNTIDKQSWQAREVYGGIKEPAELDPGTKIIHSLLHAHSDHFRQRLQYDAAGKCQQTVDILMPDFDPTYVYVLTRVWWFPGNEVRPK